MKTIGLILVMTIAITINGMAQTDTLAPKPIKTIFQQKMNVKGVTERKVNSKELPNPPKAVETVTIYIYKLKNKKLKSKFWYHPSEQIKPLDYYIEKGWRIVKVKKLNRPPFLERLIALGQIIFPMVKESIKKNTDSN